jgi:hypothetical protein
VEDAQKPLVQNAASPSQTRAAKKREKRSSERELQRLRVVLSTREGRRWYWEKMAFCGMWLKRLPKDPQLDAYALGVRNIGLELFEEVNMLGPDVFLQMQKEHREDVEKGM